MSFINLSFSTLFFCALAVQSLGANVLDSKNFLSRYSNSDKERHVEKNIPVMLSGRETSFDSQKNIEFREKQNLDSSESPANDGGRHVEALAETFKNLDSKNPQKYSSPLTQNDVIEPNNEYVSHVESETSLESNTLKLALNSSQSTQTDNTKEDKEKTQSSEKDKDLSTQDSEIIQKQMEQKAKEFLFGRTDLLSKDAPYSVALISSELLEKTGFRVMININDISTSGTQEEKFESRRDFEKLFLASLFKQKNTEIPPYAIIFLFYNDHNITIRTNATFLNTQELLEQYAYPYLPAESVGSHEYNDGVNEGLSNLYLALSHKIAQHYKIELNAPEPMEKPRGVTKVIIYAMLLFLIVLFLLVSNGFFRKAEK